MLIDKRSDLFYLQIWNFKVIYHILKQKYVKSEKYRAHKKIDYLVEYEDHIIKTVKIWLSDFRKIIIKCDVKIDENNQKYDDKNSTESFYDENDEISIWDFINSSNQTIIIKKKKKSILFVINIHIYFISCSDIFLICNMCIILLYIMWSQISVMFKNSSEIT